MPLPLSSSVPLPVAIVRPVAVSEGLSMSDALARSSAWVISRPAVSSAIAAYLARGDELLAAVQKGKAFVTEAIRAALPLGGGIGPVDQLWGIET